MDNFGTELLKSLGDPKFFFGADYSFQRDVERSMKLKDVIVERLLMWDLHCVLMRDSLVKKHGKDKQYFEFVNKRYVENPWLSFLPKNVFIEVPEVVSTESNESTIEKSSDGKVIESRMLFGSGVLDSMEKGFIEERSHYNDVLFDVLSVFVKNNKDFCASCGVNDVLLSGCEKEWLVNGKKDEVIIDGTDSVGDVVEVLDKKTVQTVIVKLLGEHRLKSYNDLGEHFIRKNSIEFFDNNFLSSLMINDLSKSEWECALGLNEPNILKSMLVGEEIIEEVEKEYSPWVGVSSIRAVRQQERFINLMNALRVSKLSTTLINSTDKFWAFRQKIKERNQEKKTFFKRTNIYFDVNMSAYMSDCLELKRNGLKKENSGTSTLSSNKFEVSIGESLLEAINYKKKTLKNTLVTSGLLVGNSAIISLLKGATGSDVPGAAALSALVLFSAFNLYKLFESKNTPIQYLYDLVLNKYGIEIPEVKECLNKNEKIKSAFFTNFKLDIEVKKAFKSDKKYLKNMAEALLSSISGIALKEHVLAVNVSGLTKTKVERDLFCDDLYLEVIRALNGDSNGVLCGRAQSLDDSLKKGAPLLSSTILKRIKENYNDPLDNSSTAHLNGYTLTQWSESRNLDIHLTLKKSDYFEIKKYMNEIELLKVATNRDKTDKCSINDGNVYDGWEKSCVKKPKVKML